MKGNPRFGPNTDLTSMWYFKVSLLLSALIMLSTMAHAETPIPENLLPPATDGIWIRPAAGDCIPIYGFKDGIRLGIQPARRPRGIVRIYAPYVLPEQQYPAVNFMAIEPIVNGWRSLSEIEHSALDDTRGKRIWFTDLRHPDPPPLPAWNSSRGRLGTLMVGGKKVETLTVYLNVEKLDNGAQPIVQVMFRSDRPNEVGFKVYAAKDSAPMESCVITATMGNYSRTRLLWLKDEVMDSRKLWPDYKGNEFVGTDEIPASRMLRSKDGTLTVAISPSESDLSDVSMPPSGWPFHGKVSTQYWRKYPGTAQKDLRVKVNGRASYYGGHAPIPGGVAFENFELIEGFKAGVESWFGISLKTPEEMGWPK